MKNKTNRLSSAVFALFLLLIPADAIDATTRAALLEIIPAVVCLFDGGCKSRSRRDKQHRIKG